MTDTTITPSPATQIFVNKFEPEYFPLDEKKNLLEWIQQFQVYEKSKSPGEIQNFLAQLVLPRKENLSQIMSVLAKNQPENEIIQQYQTLIEHIILKSGYDPVLIKHWWNVLSTKSMPKYKESRRRFRKEYDDYDG